MKKKWPTKQFRHACGHDVAVDAVFTIRGYALIAFVIFLFLQAFNQLANFVEWLFPNV
ncbi:hypothetical protein YOLOSWAG_269 [Erwinia phage vB_EamM_Yoloswag]|uniref:Uncharacterized protein n=1 Tax=Erwinia phage vB_EamM_Yoloswag TaxID=1958956 RepID=A0A1S6L3J1_9CAUD|nr:hypothetical protein HOR66_gp269 [Erwinia phage vB_EamM_Yoloswag]AQT28742.1 hypothetical protein YOLOSWAG_269 [Erwinia phage vB_EamM_Yoloswag]